MKSLPLGAHMSVEGGLFRALERGKSIGCRTIQLFTRNSNRWAAKDLTLLEIEKFKSSRLQTGITPVFAHCSYLINLAAPEFYERSIRALILQLERARQLGLEFVVLHPGAHRGAGEIEGLKMVVEALEQVIAETKDAKCKIAIENTAGQGSSIGCTFEQLDYIFSHLSNPDRIGYCIDTCHLFAAGYDLRTEKRYKEVFRRLSHHIPLSSILAFHFNDSKKPIGSRVDRHEHIGKGHIGSAAFC